MEKHREGKLGEPWCLAGSEESERGDGEEDLLISGWVLGGRCFSSQETEPGEGCRGAPELRLGHVTSEIPLGHPGGRVRKLHKSPTARCLPGPTSSHLPCPPHPQPLPGPAFHSTPEPPASWKAPVLTLAFQGPVVSRAPPGLLSMGGPRTLPHFLPAP